MQSQRAEIAEAGAVGGASDVSRVRNTGARASHSSSSADLDALNRGRVPRGSRCANETPDCAA